MNKKILSLLFLLLLLVSVTISYAIFFQPSTTTSYETDPDTEIDEDTISSEIDLTLFDENEDIEIGEMI